MTDNEIETRALIRGRPDARRAVVEARYAGVYRSLFYLCGDRDTAADLTQETFVQAWRNLRSVRDHATVGAWLRVIAARAWWKHRRARRDNAVLDDFAETLPAPGDSPDEIVLARVQWQEVSCAVARLPEGYRALVVLHHLEQLTHREIADALGIPIGTVKSRLFEAMRRLRRTLLIVGKEI